MFRRDFLGCFTSALALSACSIPNHVIEEQVTACDTPYDPSDILRIDAHTHVMNGRDSNGRAFVGRQSKGTAGVDLENSHLLFLVDFERRSHVLGPFAKALKTEVETLRDIAQQDAQHDATGTATLCRTAAERQKVLASVSTNRGYLPGLAGFTRDRLRNAALMLSNWPNVDMFAVSMVDFHEKQNGKDPYEPQLQLEFYDLLHRASLGRMLPLVSFQPERDTVATYDAEGRKTGARPYIDLVREAIEERGFIGVKVHPSVGFDPWDNFEFGCNNSGYHNDNEAERFRDVYDGRSVGSVSAEEARQKAEVWNKNMRALYRLCEELDVPILTHNSTGLSRNYKCMMPEEVTPLDWTNSSAHWVKLLDPNIGTFPNITDHTGINAYPEETYRKPKWKNLRVCLGHFADGFKEQLDSSGHKTGVYEPGPWLTAAAEFMRRDRRGALFLDLSAMKDVLTEAPQLEAFQAFMNDQRNANVLTDQVLYGSDWHMPSSHLKGYLGGFENMFSPRTKAKIMGLNAVEFYALKAGRPTRQRLLKYYKAHDIDLKNVRWHQRLRQKGLA